MPAEHSSITCRPNTPETSLAEPPRQRNVAMVRARPSSQARTPVATPMPPTSSALSPTSTRNRLVCCTARSSPASAWPASRTRQPVPGNARRRSAISAGAFVPGGSATRQSFVTSEPGWISFVAGRPAAEIITRGPSTLKPPARSGSRSRAARSTKRASPSRSVSPACSRRRCSTSGSATTPPSSARASGTGGSSTGAPSSG